MAQQVDPANPRTWVLDVIRPGSTAQDRLLAMSAAEVYPFMNYLAQFVTSTTAHDPVARSALYLMRKIGRKTGVMPDNLRVAPDDLTVDADTVVGQTKNSDIYRGTWRGRSVAVKRMRGLDEEARSGLLRELLNHAYVKHDNIVEIIGVHVLLRPNYHQPIRMEIITSWADNGRLEDYVRQPAYWNNLAADSVRLASEIARGLAYLHAQKIIHGDISGANIMVGGNGAALLVDLGSSLMGDTTLMAHTGSGAQNGTDQWMAPERHDPSQKKRNKAMDVWAYGTVVYLLMKGELAFPPQPPVGGGNGLWEVTQACRAHMPHNRWTMRQVLHYFNITPSMHESGEPLFTAYLAKKIDQAVVHPGEVNLNAVATSSWPLLEITECVGSPLWTGRSIEGFLGQIPNPAVNLIPVLCLATVQSINHTSNSIPPPASLGLGNFLRLPIRVNDQVEVMAVLGEWFIVRDLANRVSVGYVSCQDLQCGPWPSNARYGMAVTLFPHHMFPGHLNVDTGVQVEYVIRDERDPWVVARLGNERGFVPAHILRRLG